MNIHTMYFLVQWYQKLYQRSMYIYEENIEHENVVHKAVQNFVTNFVMICQKSTKNCAMHIGEANFELYFFENNVESFKPLQCGLNYNYILCAKLILKIYLQPIFRATLRYWRYIRTNYIWLRRERYL